MFDFLDKCTLICGSPAASVPKNEAELSLKEHDKDNAAEKDTLLDPVDPMDAKNYVVAHLTRPMGILFEENIDDVHLFGGAIIADVQEGCSATADGSICRGDQLVAIGTKRVSGMDFDEIIKIVEESDYNIKLTIFRGPAESLYGPSGANVEWLDEFVAERGEEAAFVEDSESEVFGHVSAHHDVLDDVALAAAAVNGHVVDETFFTACQILLDAESSIESEDVAVKVEETPPVVAEDEVVVSAEAVKCDAEEEKTADATMEASVGVEDDVVATVAVECEAEEEKTADVTMEASVAAEDAVVANEVAECEDVVDETFSTACQTLLDAKSHVEREDVTAKTEETPVLVEDEVVCAEVVECKAEEEKTIDATIENLVTDDEGDVDEEVERDCEVDNEADTSALVEDDADNEDDVACDAIPETETPILSAVNTASKNWLDNYLANPESQLVSNGEVDTVGMVDETTSDLEARCKKAVEVKEAALASVIENESGNGTKGILKESRYSPKGVDEIKAFESDAFSTEESNDDDSAVSSVWSEPDDYIGEIGEVPVKRGGSTLAAMGAASTLTTNMMLA
mmetsp:Transcript_5812/g.9009  ORF Transcript_5812/g.9009 Transcript_5812/m.9009 type:complete len:572 (+) Transcript_5812:169-1884(+)